MARWRSLRQRAPAAVGRSLAGVSVAGSASDSLDG